MPETRTQGLWFSAFLLGLGSCSLLAPSDGELLESPSVGGAPSRDGMAPESRAGQNMADQGTHEDANSGADAGMEGGCSGTVCGSDCVDTETDAQNCGACGRACRAGHGCALGRCGDEIASVAAGIFSSCVVLRAGQVHCWGENRLGQLGDGSFAGTETCGQATPCRPSAQPVMLRESPLADISDVAISAYHACAVDRNGAAWCWGENTYGQLGHAGGDQSCTTQAGAMTACNSVPTRVGLPAGIRTTQISVGLHYTCALTSGGDVYCWGRNNYGQLGLPLSVVSTPVPTKVAGLARPAVQLSTAIQGDVSGVLADDGTIWCWGYNPDGGLGHAPSEDPICGGTARCSFTPRAVEDDMGAAFSGVTRVALGRWVSCALKDGGVWCWGNNGFGTFGTGTAGTAPRFAPGRVPGLSNVRSLALADLTIVATDASGVSWAWGRNNLGTVGDGTIAELSNGCSQACRPIPTRINVPGLVQVSLSGTALAVDAQGALWIWGANGSAQLGHLPGDNGDLMCGVGAPTPGHCNPTPVALDWLP